MAILKPALTHEEIKKMGLAQMRVAYEDLAHDYNRIMNGEVYYCHYCNEFHMADGFYLDRNYASGLFPECKKRLLLQATDYDKKTNTYKDNKEKTKRVFQKMNLPFIESIYNSSLASVQEGVGERNRSTAYQQMLTTIKSLPVYRGLTWEDSDFDDTEVYNPELTKKARKEIKKLFGSGFTETDYLYLQDQYDDWRSRTQVDTKSQETYIVQICFKQLEIWKAQKAGKDTDKAIKSLNDLMNGANLQPRQNVDSAASDSLCFGQMIQKWELEQPVSEPAPEFRDVDGIGKYLRVWFAGWLGKVLGLNNVYTKECEDYISEYIVNKPDCSNEDGTTNIYNQIFGSDGESS